LQWVWRGPSVAVGDALLACLAVTVLAMVTTGGPGAAMPYAVGWCLPVVVGCVIGGILRATGSLKMGVQVILLLCFFGVGLYSIFGPMPQVLADEDLRVLLEALGRGDASFVADGSRDAIQFRLIGFLGLQICLELIATMFVITWLLGFARRRREFAKEYRSLTIGYVLGVPFALVFLAALVSDSTLLHNLFGVAGLAWLLRGLVYCHCRVHAIGAHPVVYVPVYVFGVLFGFSLLIQGIFSNGLID
jgi:hypothetical protein